MARKPKPVPPIIQAIMELNNVTLERATEWYAAKDRKGKMRVRKYKPVAAILERLEAENQAKVG